MLPQRQQKHFEGSAVSRSHTVGASQLGQMCTLLTVGVTFLLLLLR